MNVVPVKHSFSDAGGEKEVVMMGKKWTALLRPANILFDFTQVY